MPGLAHKQPKKRRKRDKKKRFPKKHGEGKG